jgi:hypothetical protein
LEEVVTAFGPGAQVIFRGLRTRTDLNGREAVVLGHGDASDRIVVRTEGLRRPEMLKCKAGNLMANSKSDVEYESLAVGIMRAVNLSLDGDYALKGSIAEEAVRLRASSARCAPLLTVGDVCQLARCARSQHDLVYPASGREDDDVDSEGTETDSDG